MWHVISSCSSFLSSSKYSKGYSSYRADKKFYTNANAEADAEANWIRPQNNMYPPPFLLVKGRGDKNIGNISWEICKSDKQTSA